MSTRLSRAQYGLLKAIGQWSDMPPDAEEAAGCHGAAFEAVLASLWEHDLIEPWHDEHNSIIGPEVSAKGRAALAWNRQHYRED